MTNRENVSIWREELRGKSAREVVKWVYRTFDTEKIALASSFSIEDQAVLAMMLEVEPKARVFTLDTGRHFQKTYQVIDETRMKYGIKVEMLFPERKDVEEMLADKGPNLFYDSVENRKLCCDVRKVRPLKRMLATLDVWITGLRREQSVTRGGVEVVEWDEGNGLVKLNPIVDWNENDTRDFVKSTEYLIINSRIKDSRP
jgi:phosphoadenosine phosphosulfate reductase